MNNIYLEELKDNLKAGMNDISIDFASDYDITQDDYISDLFCEYADNRVDVYNSNLLEWAKYNYEYIEEAIDEYGDVAKDPSGRADFMRTIQQGQFLYYERQLYEDAEDIIKLLAINYLLENEDEVETEMDNDRIDEMLDDIDVDTNDRMSDIKDVVWSYIKKEEEDA